MTGFPLTLHDMKNRLPWWAKILAKIIICRLPVSYALWRRLDLFRHGEMDDPAHAITVFRSHYERATALRPLREGFTMLEIGPGDSLFSAVIAKSFGAARSFLIDGGPFARHNLAPYRALEAVLKAAGLCPLRLTGHTTIEEILTAVSGTYLTAGLESFAQIEDHSVDFIWSNVALEHVARPDFQPMVQEMRRVLKSDGVMSHSIDLRDHLQNSLNNLRFSEGIWESYLFRNSGFYTNRLRFHEILQIFEDGGLQSKLVKMVHWDDLPLPRNKLARIIHGVA